MDCLKMKWWFRLLHAHLPTVLSIWKSSRKSWKIPLGWLPEKLQKSGSETKEKPLETLPGYTEPWAFFMDTWWDYSISSIKGASISYRIMIDQLTRSRSRQSECWVTQWNGWFIIGDSGTDKYKKTRALIHNPWLRLCSTLTGNTQILH